MTVSLTPEQLQAIEESQEPMVKALDEIKSKILHLLEVCPYLTRSMIQVGLGPGLSPSFWDPILKDLLSVGELKCVEVSTNTPTGRSLNKVIYHLPSYPYPPAKVQIVSAI